MLLAWAEFRLNLNGRKDVVGLNFLGMILQAKLIGPDSSAGFSRPESLVWIL